MSSLSVNKLEAEKSEERYQAFIRNSHEGIWRVELEQPIPTHLSPKRQIELMYQRAYLGEANDAMARMYGQTSAQKLIGLRLGDLLVKEDPLNVAYLTAFIKAGYSLSGVDSHEVDALGNDKYFNNSLVGVIENGAIVRAWGTQLDVTEQHLAAEALQKSQETLDLALKASSMGMWEWNIQTGELYWSDELKQMFGLSVKDVITYEEYQLLIHPDDKPTMHRTVQQAMRRGSGYQVEHRIMWPDGSIHWLLGQGKAFLDAKGKAVRMLGTCMNIDGRKETEMLLQESKELELRTQALTRERTELMALNKAKDEFTSLASHQLRTPATGVKQYVGMLLEGYAGPLPKNQLTLLQAAYASNERQIEIVNDLLKVARLDAGQVSIVRARTDLVRLVKSVIKEQRSVFAARKQQVTVVEHSSTITADVDKDKIRMVLDNLMDNASKYTPPNKHITVSFGRTQKHVTIHIADEGVGVAKKDYPKLFQKFSRISNQLSAEVGGTGLGLYWAKNIVDLHGGSITVDSHAKRGSTFTITLPRRST